MPDRPTICDLDAPWPERIAATTDSKSERTRTRARDLRQHMSLPEVKLWQRLRGRKLNGLRFRRQHPIGHFLVDFYCHELLMVIEIDGHAAHAHRKLQDDARDEWMRRQAILVVRMSARLVLEDIGTAIAQIARKAEERRASLAGQRALADKSVDEARESR
jgi:very-short-patch-repair endonuclease